MRATIFLLMLHRLFFMLVQSCLVYKRFTHNQHAKTITILNFLQRKITIRMVCLFLQFSGNMCSYACIMIQFLFTKLVSSLELLIKHLRHQRSFLHEFYTSHTNYALPIIMIILKKFFN